jgi:mannose-6-phosphate isomerase-like protein (cupin superfamily)
MNYIFETKNRKRYAFPTHANDIVIDRKDASVSEVVLVLVEPGKATHLHKHDDLEQIFYILEGNGVLTIGADTKKKEFPVQPTQVVRIPPGTLHTIRAKGKKTLRYIDVNCFCACGKGGETTWEKHVKVICRENGYLFKNVVSG